MIKLEDEDGTKSEPSAPEHPNGENGDDSDDDVEILEVVSMGPVEYPNQMMACWGIFYSQRYSAATGKIEKTDEQIEQEEKVCAITLGVCSPVLQDMKLAQEIYEEELRLATGEQIFPKLTLPPNYQSTVTLSKPAAKTTPAKRPSSNRSVVDEKRSKQGM